jgi:hypothetical protein
VPTPAQDPINPLSCRSITAAAAAPTLAPYDARLHPTFTRDSIPTCLEFMLRALVPSNSHPYLLASSGSWVSAPSPRSNTTHTHSLHAMALAVLTPTRPPNYLPASSGDDFALHTSACSPAPSLPLLLTELVAAPSPSLPHHTHYTIALAFVTPTRPPNYLPACPDDARQTARTRVASAPLRSARRKTQHCGTWVCWEMGGGGCETRP